MTVFTDQYLQGHFRRLSLMKQRTESGYTLQTLIIVAILVLGATVAFTIIYAILDDSTDNIVGGSESFSGVPGPPQNVSLEFLTDPSYAEMEGIWEADVRVSWDSPSYLGESQLDGYLPTIDGGSPVECDYTLNRDEPAPTLPTTRVSDTFSYSNSCDWEDIDVCKERELIEDSLELSLSIRLAQEGNYEYRYEIRIDNNEFCENAGTDTPTQVDLEAQKMEQARLDLEEAEQALEQVGVMEFSIKSEEVYGGILPQVTIASSPCEDGLNGGNIATTFTFYWALQSDARNMGEVSFESCERILPIDVEESTGNEVVYLVWGETIGSTGRLQVSQTVTWIPTYENGNPAPDRPTSPRNLRIFPSGSQDIFITWDPPEINSNAIIRDYRLSVYGIAKESECISPDSQTLYDLFEESLSIEQYSGSFTINWEEVDSTDVLCFEIYAITEDKESHPSAVRSLTPYEIDTGEYSWIRVDERVGEATIFWQATNPLEISHFDIFLYDNRAEVCNSEDGDLVETATPNHFGSIYTYTETIPIVTTKYLCILVAYANGHVSQLRYGDDNKPLTAGPTTLSSLLPSIESFALMGSDSVTDALELAVSMSLDSSIYPRFYVCLDILLPDGVDTWGSRVEISRQVIDETSVTFEPLQYDNAGTLTNIVVQPGQTYEVRGWISSGSTCAYPATYSTDSYMAPG